MIAAFKAGFAFSRAGVGNVHAIAHTLGGLYNTPHGLANAVILPIVLEDYGEAVYPKLARLCEIAGVKTDGTDAEKARAFIAEIYATRTIRCRSCTTPRAAARSSIPFAPRPRRIRRPRPPRRKYIGKARFARPCGAGFCVRQTHAACRSFLLPMPPWSTKRQKRLSGCADMMR